MKNVTFSDFINQIALFSVRSNIAERQDKKEKNYSPTKYFFVMKNSSYKFKNNIHNFGRRAELSGSKKEKEGDRNGRWSRSNI